MTAHGATKIVETATNSDFNVTVTVTVEWHDDETDVGIRRRHRADAAYIQLRNAVNSTELTLRGVIADV